MIRLRIALVIALSLACDRGITRFTVEPRQLDCPGPVTVSWTGPDGAKLDANQAVIPALPTLVAREGSRVESVTTTTTFSLFHASAPRRELTVTVASPVCGSGPCGPTVLTFTGRCISSRAPPSYGMLTIDAAVAPGLLKDLHADAALPIHVLRGEFDIPLGANDGPTDPLPLATAAGDYMVTIPGKAGIKLCAAAAVSGGMDAPPIHLTVTPTCPR